jgi:hypothetical protein
VSRRTHSKGVSGATSAIACFPFRLKEIAI